jgi:hypothetical protein
LQTGSSGWAFLKFNFTYIPCLTPSDSLVQNQGTTAHVNKIKYVCCCGHIILTLVWQERNKCHRKCSNCNVNVIYIIINITYSIL